MGTTTQGLNVERETAADTHRRLVSHELRAAPHHLVDRSTPAVGRHALGGDGSEVVTLDTGLENEETTRAFRQLRFQGFRMVNGAGEARAEQKPQSDPDPDGIFQLSTFRRVFSHRNP